ncbi:MAG TPA: hypothetical protein VMT10_01020 [Solirubrobacteraceae bacterium]|nr:hypothetical protein [Solirubrobacteraceae bacterium]
MTDQPTDSPAGDPGRAPTEDELRAAYEAELKQLRVEDVILQTVVSLLNLGARKAGLVPGSEDELDLEQTRLAIEAVRGLLVPIDDQLGENGRPLRDALAQLQLAYAQRAGTSATPAPGGAESPGGAAQPGAAETPAADQGPGPAQRSGRLWVPGQ